MDFPAVNPVPDIVVVANPWVGDRVMVDVDGAVQAEATVITVKESTMKTSAANTFFIVNSPFAIFTFT